LNFGDASASLDFETTSMRSDDADQTVEMAEHTAHRWHINPVVANARAVQSHNGAATPSDCWPSISGEIANRLDLGIGKIVTV
jgi:hypothetical protein